MSDIKRLKAAAAPAALPPVPPKLPSPLLKDLAGMAEACAWGEELAIDFAAYRAETLPWSDIDSGALIWGPPGTGKTTFARALANTCGCHLVATSYAQWQSAGDQHLGSTLDAMRQDFHVASQMAPTVLFIDELDALPARQNGSSQSVSYWNAVVNGLLELVDGISARDGVVLVGACNNPQGLDPALLRPGRLDRKFQIRPPGLDDLPRIFRFHIGDTAIRDADLARLAVLCLGMTGADIERIVRDAKRRARQNGRPLVADDLTAIVLAGSLPPDTAVVRRIAVHEAAHAVAFLRTGLSQRISASILRNGASAGRVSVADLPDILTREVIDRLLLVCLAGRAAEEIMIGEASAGAGGSAESDLAMATRLVRDAIASFGLAPQRSLVWYGGPTGNADLDYRSPLAAEIDAILTEAYDRTRAFVTAERRAIDRVANALVNRRALVHSDIVLLADSPRP